MTGELPVITREQFSLAPIELLRQCKKRKGTVFVYLWLWHYAGENNSAWPSVDRQAEECGMDVDDIREARKWLVANGWITRIERPGRSTMFRVRSERPEVPTPPPKAPLPQTTPPPKTGGHPSPKWGGGTRTKEQELEKNPPTPPKTTKSNGKRKLVLPEWLEPYRSDLEQWQANRKRAYPKLAPGLTATSIKALEYARSVGVLAEYCSYVSERNWQSLGFIGHQETIDKLAGRNPRNNGRNSTTNPVVYTLT